MNSKTSKQEKKKLIENRSMQILRFLNLTVKNSNIVDQLGIVLRLYKYVVQKVFPEEQSFDDKAESTKQ